MQHGFYLKPSSNMISKQVPLKRFRLIHIINIFQIERELIVFSFYTCEYVLKSKDGGLPCE